MKKKLNFKVAIIGLTKIRVGKVISLLFQNPSSSDNTAYSIKNSNQEYDVEYFPCVAKFDTYMDDSNNPCKYLSKIDYYPLAKENSTLQPKGCSLAPFFDDNNDTTKLGVVIGCGIDESNDISMIITFMETMSIHPICHTLPQEKKQRFLLVNTIRPNPEYTSMKEENLMYRNLSRDKKEHLSNMERFGPGKMCKFIKVFRHQLQQYYSTPTTTNEAESNIESISQTTIVKLANNDKEVEQNDEERVKEQEQVPKQEGDEEKVQTNDFNNTLITRYACKQCRSILFTKENVENPPHVPAQHSFTKYRKKALPSSTIACNSIFLSSPLPWMTCAGEGKISCYKCQSKLGFLKWSGSQCSCGTWITPAIQIHLSRVDVILPTPTLNEMSLTASTDEISPTVAATTTATTVSTTLQVDSILNIAYP